MGLLPDVSFLCSDRDLGAQKFTVNRKTGTWNAGRFIPGEPQTLTSIGNIQSPTPEQLAFFPEGVRVNETKVVYTTTMLYTTDGERISDEIIWNGHTYKVVRADRWDDWGYCVAYATRR